MNDEKLIWEAYCNTILESNDIDLEYMQAYENNDEEKARSIVEQAAKSAGYIYGPMWHHTTKGAFNEFIQQPIHDFTGSNGTFGHFGTKEQSTKMHNRALNAMEWFNSMARNEEEKSKPSLRSFYIKAENIKRVNDDTLGPQWGWIAHNNRNRGFDCLVYDNKVEGKGDSMVPLKSPSQIKLADAFTFDDNKNLIPLSQRFDSSKNDVRY